MPKLSDTAVPTYRLHKQSGQAIVTLNGRDKCLGTHGTQASKDNYNRLIAEWIANGRCFPRDQEGLTVTELIAAFWKHVESYYRRPDGTPSPEQKNYRDALGPLRKLYSTSQAASFGPLALKAVRGEMIRRGWCRSNINKQVRRIKATFKWAVENELVPPSVYHGLAAVAGLKAGRTEAPDRAPIKPVSEQAVETVLVFASRQVAAMARLQLVTGMRPGEVCMMRSMDIIRDGAVWTYSPATHKTQHHGHERQIYLGKRAQDIILPFLKADPCAYLFSPADADSERRAMLSACRTTPIMHGNRCGSNRKPNPARKPGPCYTTMSYAKAVRAAWRKAEIAAREIWPDAGAGTNLIEAWHPHQLRHTAATRLRTAFGLEATQVILGHKSLTVTQVYAERNVNAAQKIMAQVG